MIYWRSDEWLFLYKLSYSASYYRWCWDCCSCSVIWAIYCYRALFLTVAIDSCFSDYEIFILFYSTFCPLDSSYLLSYYSLLVYYCLSYFFSSITSDNSLSSPYLISFNLITSIRYSLISWLSFFIDCYWL